MATKSNSQRLIELRKKRQEENSEKSTSSTSSTSSTTSLSNSDKVKRLRTEREIGFDTLASDITSLSKTLDTVYNGWQTKETMQNTLSSVQSMYDRLTKYQNYQKKYGGTDLSELHSSVGSIIEGWDDLASDYGKHKNAESYTNAKKALANDKTTLEGLYSMPSGNVKKKWDIAKHLDEANKHTDEINMLNERRKNADRKSVV